MNGAYRIALLCWALPLIAGIAVFTGWYFEGVERWMGVGAVILFAGTALFILGVIALILSIRKDVAARSTSPRRLRFTSLACAGLLLSNFPVALALTGVVIRSETRYTVVVQNESAQLLEDVQVFGGGIHSATVTLPPGGATKFEVWPSTDGELRLRARSKSSDYAVVVEGYVTNMLGGAAVVTIHADGSTTVEHPED